MNRTSVVVIGAGQAGLAVSHLLTRAAVDHVVLERGRTAESWRSRRWDSLRLLTPNWLSRLPGWTYRGDDPAGFMPAESVAGYLGDYAASFDAPVVTGAEVLSVDRRDQEFVVVTGAKTWSAAAVVIATGYCAEPAVPGMARDLDSSIAQLTPDHYRNPDDVPAGTVLVVGASASGVQIADELTAAGREVLLAVGQHTRVPRRYRGMDILWWLDSMGLLDKAVEADQLPRPAETSLQLVGSTDGRDVDLVSLADRGTHLLGRLRSLQGGQVTVADDLAVTTSVADARLDRLRKRIDLFAEAAGLTAEIEPPAPLRTLPTLATRPWPPLTLGRGAISSVVWATGYRRRYPWLRLPVVDGTGDIRQRLGRTAVPGLVVVGMAWQSRRDSTFLDGVRHDAALVVDHLLADILGASRGRWAA